MKICFIQIAKPWITIRSRLMLIKGYNVNNYHLATQKHIVTYQNVTSCQFILYFRSNVRARTWHNKFFINKLHLKLLLMHEYRFIARYLISTTVIWAIIFNWVNLQWYYKSIIPSCALYVHKKYISQPFYQISRCYTEQKETKFENQNHWLNLL